MKIPLLVVAAAAGLMLVAAIPQLGGSCDHRTHASSPTSGTALSLDTESGAPARLRVEAGPGTTVDRGHLGNFHTRRELHGAFRYQQEQ
ncbi:MAG: hypothetical protein QNJ90_11845, partial [Planctomycetota bacterium]|nr:hypothetical protein [Planctomycetota bacterium]